MRKEKTWQDPLVALEYEERRFRTPLQRRKHRRDERLLASLLRAGGAQGPVLDVPCGTGRLVEALSRSVGPVVGVDVSLEMLRGVEADLGAGLLGCVRGSAMRLPFRAGAFGATVSVRFLFHLDDVRERVLVLSELARVTTGPVVGQVRYRWTAKHLGRYLRSLVGLSARYRASHGRAEIERELRDAGMVLERLRRVSFLFSDKVFFVARRG